VAPSLLRILDSLLESLAPEVNRFSKRLSMFSRWCLGSQLHKSGEFSRSTVFFTTITPLGLVWIPESKTGKLSLSRRREHRSALIGIQWGASVPISNLACYPIPCLVSSPLYFTVLLLLSSSVVYLSYCFSYYYSISIVIISCCYALLFSVSYYFLLLFVCFSFLLSIVVIFKFITLFIIYCCY
jgi:hypothetical protein